MRTKRKRKQYLFPLFLQQHELEQIRESMPDGHRSRIIRELLTEAGYLKCEKTSKAA